MAAELARRRDGALSPPPFSVASRRDRDTVFILAAGELDVATCAQVRTELESVLESSCAHVVIDLRRLTFMDSSALHLLVATQRAALRRGIRLSLIRGPDAVNRTLEVAGMHDRFEFITP